MGLIGRDKFAGDGISRENLTTYGRLGFRRREKRAQIDLSPGNKRQNNNQHSLMSREDGMTSLFQRRGIIQQAGTTGTQQTGAEAISSG